MNFFSDVGRKTYEKTQEELAQNHIPPVMNRTFENHIHSSHFKPSPVDCDTVILTIKHLNDSKAWGSDGIPLRFIKDSLFVIAFYLSVIINTSIVTNTFPELWKKNPCYPCF